MKNIKRYRMKNYRIFVEKHPRFRVEAESLRRELNANLNLDIRELRLLNVYDLFGFSEELLEKTRYSVFGEVVTDSTKKNLAMRVEAECGATEGKMQLAKKAKALNYDAIHDTVHEMARDEARHGKALKGLLDRYFG